MLKTWQNTYELSICQIQVQVWYLVRQLNIILETFLSFLISYINLRPSISDDICRCDIILSQFFPYISTILKQPLMCIYPNEIWLLLCLGNILVAFTITLPWVLSWMKLAQMIFLSPTCVNLWNVVLGKTNKWFLWLQCLLFGIKWILQFIFGGYIIVDHLSNLQLLCIYCTIFNGLICEFINFSSIDLELIP